MWPENEPALDFFQRIGTRWIHPPLGGPPIGIRWEAVYPLMERLNLSPDAWDALHDDIQHLEYAAINTMREFAPKPKK